VNMEGRGATGASFSVSLSAGAAPQTMQRAYVPPARCNPSTFNLLHSLLDSSNHKLQIPSFGKVRWRRMIERLTSLVDDLQPSVGDSASCCQRFAERLRSYLGGATGGCQQTAGNDAAHTKRVEPRICSLGCKATLLAPSKTGRIEDHQIKAFPRGGILLQQLETVGGFKVMSSIVEIVEHEVMAGCCRQSLATIDANDPAGAAAE